MAFADILVAKIERRATGAFNELLRELREGKLTKGEAGHIGAVLLKEVGLHSVRSLSLESYWGSVVKLGDVAFKYSLRPHPDTPTSVASDGNGPDYLRDELLSRLARGPVKWQLCVQLFVDESHTKVNDAATVWSSAPVVVGELALATAPSADDERTVNQMAFNPGHGFDPLGITHARVDVYAASAQNRADRGLLSTEATRAYLAGP